MIIFEHKSIDKIKNCVSKKYTFVSMKDLNENAFWNPGSSPGGSSLWVPVAGRLTSYGESRYHSFPDYFCPHVIISGRGIVEVNGISHEMKRGDMFTLWPGSEILYHDFPETPWRFYYFHLEGEDRKAYVRALGLTREKPVNRPQRTEAVISAFGLIWKLLLKKPRLGQYQVLSTLFRLPELCDREENAAGQDDDLAEQAKALIGSSFNPAGLNVNELCERLGVSRVTLYRHFTARQGITPTEFIIRRRLDNARFLLSDTVKTVAEIAGLAGFNSEKYFLKQFKQRFGLTPSEFRNRHQT